MNHAEHEYDEEQSAHEHLHAQLVAATEEGDEALALPLLAQLRDAQYLPEIELLMLEGDLWYAKGEFERCLPPYSAAVAIAPEDYDAVNNYALALVQCKHTEDERYTLEAIRMFERCLELADFESEEWCWSHSNLGNAYCYLQTGGWFENQEKAIWHYEQSVTYSARENEPVSWARRQHNLGMTLLRRADAGEHARYDAAMKCFQSALEVYPEDDTNPRHRPLTMQYVARVLVRSRNGDQEDKVTRALSIYENILDAFPREFMPESWAEVYRDIADALLTLPDKDKPEIFDRIVASYAHALSVYTVEVDPVSWARTQLDLAFAYYDRDTYEATALPETIHLCKKIVSAEATWDTMLTHGRAQNLMGSAYAALESGDHASNLRQAIACNQAALAIFEQEDHPAYIADALSDLATHWIDLAEFDSSVLSHAVDALRRALEIIRYESDPLFWARLQRRLGTALGMQTDASPAGSFEEARNAFHAALSVIHRDTDPEEWGGIQNNLGLLYARTERPENFASAKSYTEAATDVFQELGAIENWWDAMENLAGILENNSGGENADAYFAEALHCYERMNSAAEDLGNPVLRADAQASMGMLLGKTCGLNDNASITKALSHLDEALAVYDAIEHPEAWARVMNNRGNVLARKVTSGDESCLDECLACYEAVLHAHPRDSHPESWSRTQNNIGHMLLKLPFGERRENLERAAAAFNGTLQMLARLELADAAKTTRANLDDTRAAWLDEAIGTAEEFDSIPPTV